MKQFNYLGSTITEDGRCDIDIKKRIGMAKEVFYKMEKVFKSYGMTMETKKRILKCYVTNVLNVWQRMLDNLAINGRKIRGSRDVVL